MAEGAGCDTLIAERHIERRPGADTGVEALLAKHAGMAVLAEQNLRATSAGGHVAIERAPVI